MANLSDPLPVSSTAAPTLITQPGATLAPLYTLISSAARTLDITMYELVDTQAEQLLTAAAARGVTVRVILDNRREQTHNTPAYTYLNANGVHAVWAPAVFAATHQKTITVDSHTSAILTLNLTSRYYATSRDFAIVTTDPVDIAAIQATFNADFTAATITPPDATNLVWSPTNATSVLVALITSATRTLDIENEEMSAPAIVSALEAAATRGVTVNITMSLNPAYTPEYTALTAAGAHIRTYAQNAPLYIHAKIILVDAALPTRKAFLGSENFSTASLTRNRELGLTLTDPTVLASLAATLMADFKGATPWTPAIAARAIGIPVREAS